MPKEEKIKIMSTPAQAFKKWQKEEFRKSLEHSGEDTVTFIFEQIQEELDRFKLDFVRDGMERILKKTEGNILIGITKNADRIIGAIEKICQ